MRPTGSTTATLTPIMITGNTYELGLFNGDTGVLADLAAGVGSEAFFPDPDSGVRRISVLRLPQHETAFVLTVHKTQGSEFDSVLLILPDQMSEILSRELLYTAVTRSRKRVEIWGDEEVFRRAVERRIARNTGLRDRLWGEVPS
jgi:exodeoxyribonuclease V alpha subunit